MKKKILSLTLILSLLIAQASTVNSVSEPQNADQIASEIILPRSSDPGLPPPL